MSTRTFVRIFLLGLPLGIILIGAGCIFYSVTREDSPTLPNVTVRTGKPIDAASLEYHVRTLAEKIGPRHAGAYDNLQSARFYLESTLGVNNIGYTVRSDTYTLGGKEFANLIVELPGTKMADEIIVIGAHYDTIKGSPGANDNASGIAVLLELAEAFASEPQPRTIRFAAFTNEEPPYFQTKSMGSYRYAQSCKKNGDDIVAMLALETLGYYDNTPNSQKYPPGLASKYPDTGNFVGVVSNLSSKRLVDFTHGAFRVHANGAIPVEKGAFPPILPGIGWSDHWSFWQFGYPAVMITDTAPYRYPHYHEKSDTPDKLDFQKLAIVATTLESVIRELATAPKL